MWVCRQSEAPYHFFVVERKRVPVHVKPTVVSFAASESIRREEHIGLAAEVFRRVPITDALREHRGHSVRVVDRKHLRLLVAFYGRR